MPNWLDGRQHDACRSMNLDWGDLAVILYPHVPQVSRALHTGEY